MSCFSDGSPCWYTVGTSSYSGVCKYVGVGQFVCEKNNTTAYPICNYKDQYCMALDDISFINGVCKYYSKNTSQPVLGCKMHGGAGSGDDSGSGSGSGSINVDFGNPCVNPGDMCNLMILGTSYWGNCSYFYTGNGNYEVNCAIDWNASGSGLDGGTGNGSGSGSGYIATSCAEPKNNICSEKCSKIINGQFREGQCLYETDQNTNKGRCVCTINH